ncbi:kinase-like domain-containing protein [Suillus ampliporus]|nr:kinase-like domain-containing protein [Suillus ampliporus]
MIKTVLNPRSKSAKTRAELKAEEAAELERLKALRVQKELAAFGTEPKRRPGALSTKETWWCERYQWLKDQGYLLRPRYAPDWVPSWEGSKRNALACEDGQVMRFGRIMDATRLSDGLYVSLKVIRHSEHPHEAEIGQYFMEDKLASDPKNHCVPFLSVLSVPNDDDTQIIVMPLLLAFNKPPFDTFGEVVECLRQLFEGLLFMHKHRIAHCDCMWMNVMMDAKDLYFEPYHPVKPHMKRDFSGHASHYTRTQRPPKYYLIDFGLSRQYDANDENPLEYPVLGGDKTVPEFQNNMDVLLNPFPTDVYYLGNIIREQFLDIKTGFEFLKPLVDDMVQDDPSKRPTMEQAVERFDLIRQNLNTWKLRSRVTAINEGPFEHVYRGAAHWRRRIGFIVKRVSATPRLPQ